MSQERPSDLSAVYPELISPMDGRPVDPEEMEQATAVVQIAMEGIEPMLAAVRITNVQISFEVIGEEGNLEFNFSAPTE